jgi:hypothetical protein
VNEQILARLEGGPAELPDRVCTVPADQDKIKVIFRGGREHFERASETAGDEVIYRWTTRTKIAE